MFPKPANSSAKELADAIQSNPAGAIKILAEHDLALTAAVRREDASEVIRCQSAPGVWADSPDAVATGILALITPDQQSALDAYRDSVLSEACIRVANWFKAHRIDYASSLWEIESALKGSSDAAKEA